MTRLLLPHFFVVAVVLLADPLATNQPGQAEGFAPPPHLLRVASSASRHGARQLVCSNQEWVGVDWDLLWGTTVGFCKTEVGKKALGRISPYSQSPRAIAMWHDVIGEINAVEAPGLPLDGILDVRSAVHRCAIGGVLTYADLKRVYTSVMAMYSLSEALSRGGDYSKTSCPTLHKLWAGADPSPGLVQLLRGAFDQSTGELCEKAYPSLSALRRNALAELVDTGAPGDALRKVEEEEARLAASLSRPLGGFAASLTRSVCAGARMDAASARAQLARRTGGVRVTVGREGVVNVLGLRHALVEMWGGGAVGNDVMLAGEDPQGIVVSGPNGGGKTVYMKSIGLAVLLVAHGCFVPCQLGGRVDIFKHVGVTVGDAQDISADLSTFSAHVGSLSRHAHHARDYGPDSLFLVDEICSGTDPRYGASLAVACLEDLAGTGARVVTTTHYTLVKALSTKDCRFTSASVSLTASVGVPLTP